MEAISKTEKYKKLSKQYLTSLENLKKTMDEEQIELFIIYEEAKSQFNEAFSKQ